MAHVTYVKGGTRMQQKLNSSGLNLFDHETDIYTIHKLATAQYAELQTAVTQAAIQGTLTKEVNRIDKNGFTPVALAVRSGNLKNLQLLLSFDDGGYCIAKLFNIMLQRTDDSKYAISMLQKHLKSRFNQLAHNDADRQPAQYICAQNR